MKRHQGGSVMLEAVLVFPVVLMAILAAWQLAEIAVADLAVGWASRIAARSAAVHPGEAEAFAHRAAVHALAPFLPPLPAEPAAALGVRWLARAVAYAQAPEAAGLSLGVVQAKGRLGVRVTLAYRLRVPLAAALFGRTRTLARDANFPVMYAPED